RIHIQPDGWAILDATGSSRGALRFQNVRRASAFDRPQAGSTVSYFAGIDPKRWIRGVPAYRQIRQTGIYPGVDVVYYGRNTALEFDLIVAPHAFLRHISLVWTGAGSPALGADGSLFLPADAGNMRLAPPVA